MVNIIWAGLIIIAIIYSFLTGNIETINNGILTHATSGMNLIIEMMPLIVLWTGIMKIAEDAGLLKVFSKILNPILSKLFPSLNKDHKALGYIASNIAANMLGLGSAATPFGLKAMDELQKDNPRKDTATEAMITFLILNTGGVTLIPTTVIALRIMHGSANPTEIIITSILATSVSSISGLILDYIIRRRNQK
ncbi:MAG: spore maturation protein [Bacilli bacterium]|jgi:spore maturation protein A|nr:spore maturation protein [Bacilli bacterium]MCX4254075.1 spore maturation protein [Bacilli bacterium]